MKNKDKEKAKDKQKEPQNQITSLVGKIDKFGMGMRISRSKPKKATTSEKQSIKSKGSSKGFQSLGLSSNLSGTLGVLGQKFDQTLIYQPRTKQNRIIYNNFLGQLLSIVQDQPQQVLRSIADQILAILRSSAGQSQKEADINAILGQKINHESFLNLANLAKALTDYKIDEQENQFRQGMIIEGSQEEDEDGNDQQQDSQGKDMEEEIIQQQDEDGYQIERKKQTQMMNIRNLNKNNQTQNLQNKLDPSLIDAHWLHSQISKYYDPVVAQNMQRQILPVLNSQNVMEIQNSLMSIFNYEHFDLIKLLIQNRKIVYLCVRFHQAKDQKQRQQILDELKSNEIYIRGVNNKNNALNNEVTKKRQNPKKQQKFNNEEFLQKEMTNLNMNIRQDEINRLNKKVLDLAIHDQTNRVNLKQQYKFKLPEGATKTEKPGYQEILIPPKTKEISKQRVQVKALPNWMHPVFSNIQYFNAIQSVVFNHTMTNDKNMLVCAPTSAGKTNVALLSIMRTISQYRLQNGAIDKSKFKIVYIAPMKALVAEITGNLSNRLKDLNISVKQLTGDMHLTKGQIQQTQVIVSTPQKWDIITRKAGDRLFTQQVRLLIIDQIHLLGDSRGPVLQSIIARTIRQVQSTQQNVRIIGLSATLPNYQDVGTLLRIKSKQGLFYFDQSYRPIPMQQLFVGITEKKGVRKMMMINQILYEKVMERVGQHQMIIFVHSRRDTVRTANSLYQTAFAKDQINKILRPDTQSKNLLQAIAEKQTINSKQLKQLLTKGIGVHHAGLSRSDRDLVEQLFADRHLNILVSTATLAWGVNLPAHTVIIKGTQVYSPQEGRWTQLSLQDIMQMLGRAGRPRYDLKGQGIIITGYEQIRYYLGLLNMQIPLESQLLKTLPDQLNAQIVLGTITTLKDAVVWLSYTYLFIRMLKNPKFYSISLEQIQEDTQLLKRRVNLVHTSAIILQKNGLVNYDRKNGNINSTFLGKIASYYYIKYPSMSIYNSNLKNNSSLIELFKIFSMSLEFKYINVRQQEKNQIQKMMESVPVPIKGSVEDANTKISALLQAHISRLKLDGYALNVDKIYITQSASRIMRALFQICLKRGWGEAAQRTLGLAKMVDKSMWNCMNPLRQFKQIPEYVLSRLQKKEQFNWQTFYEMNPQQIGDLTKFPKLGKILHKFVHHVPRLQLDAYAQPITKSCLRIDLTLKLNFKWQDQFHGKQQPFWVLLLDCNQQQILFHDYLVVNKNTDTYYMQFIAPLFTVLHPLYFIKVISDRWICSDNILPLSFKNMILPAQFSAPTQLMDLQPMPVHNLSIAKQLKITHLNQVQTQVFNSLMNFKHQKQQHQNKIQNVFIGAAEGSGKFTAVMLTFSKYLQQNKKIIIMLSHKQLLSQKVQFLTKVFSKNNVKVGYTYQDVTKDAIVLQQFDIILATPHAWQAVSRRWKSRKGFSEIGLFVADNLHLIGQGDSTMQIVVSRMRYIARQLQQSKSQFRIIGLSTSVADYQQLAGWISASTQNTFNFHPSVRQNSVEIIFNSYDQHIKESRLHNMQRNIIQHVKHFSNKNCIVFVNDKKQAKLTALDFVSLLSTSSDHHAKKMRKISDQQLQTFCKKISDQYLVHILDYGIGYIYDGMNQVQRKIIQKLFQIQAINILIITHGLKWQMSCKAFMVSILDCNYFDCKAGRWLDFSIPDMIQMMSFTSSQKQKHKLRQYQSSKFMIYCHTAKKNFYKKFLFEPYPVQSSLHLNLANHLNSAIVSKTIQNLSDSMSWLSWTFLHRRLLKNPNYYNMQYSFNSAEKIQEAESIYLSQLIQNTVEYLQGIKCIQLQEEDMSLSQTNLGIICSFYGIKVQTLAKFLSKLTINIKLKEILELISEAEELQIFSSYRAKQYQIIGQLLLPYQQKAINKIHGLLLLYLHRASVSQQFAYQTKQILPICLRLIQGLVDIVSSLTFLKPLIMTMQLSQMLIQGMWINQSPLLQVMEKPLAERLQKQFKINDMNDFINMEDEDRQKALNIKGINVQKIATACNRYPIVNISSSISQSDQQITVQVKLSRDQALDSYLIISNYYPIEKQQMWWVIIGDKKTNKVFTTKRCVLKQNAKISLSFDYQPELNLKSYTLYALCDSYLGCDQVQQISIEK